MSRTRRFTGVYTYFTISFITSSFSNNEILDYYKLERAWDNTFLHVLFF